MESWIWSIRGSSLPPMLWECTSGLPFLQPEPFFWETAWESKLLLILVGTHHWTQLRPLYILVRFWWTDAQITSLRPRETSIVYTFLCWLNLPPTYLDWSASLLRFLHALYVRPSLKFMTTTPKVVNQHPSSWWRKREAFTLNEIIIWKWTY